MSSVEKSLRRLVDKWLGGLPEGLAHVTGFGHCRRNNWRYVRIETMCSSGARAIFFFRHEDGSWCVFPPATRRPAMRVA
jgi:hypothetical protein